MSEWRDVVAAPRSQIWQLVRLIDTLVDYAVFLLDRDGHVLTWNPGAERAKGYTAEEILGEHFSLFYTPEDRAAGRPQEALATAARLGHVEYEGWRLRKDGTRFWGDVVITALFDDDGVLLGFGKVTRDLTQRRMDQEDLETFASSAAHDLQEPLRTISGFAELLARRHGASLAPDAQEFLDHISAAAERMQRLISGLLAYARAGQVGERAGPSSLNAAVRTVAEQLGAAIFDAGVAVQTSVPPDAVVLADLQGVEQVIQNLLSTRVNHAAPERPEVTLVAEREGDAWRDRGSRHAPGIPGEHRDRIFEPFTQLSGRGSGGTGLGLAICSRILRRYGGAIGVDPAPGTGSRFWFTLPAGG